MGCSDESRAGWRCRCECTTSDSRAKPEKIQCQSRPRPTHCKVHANHAATRPLITPIQQQSYFKHHRRGFTSHFHPCLRTGSNTRILENPRHSLEYLHHEAGTSSILGFYKYSEAHRIQQIAELLTLTVSKCYGDFYAVSSPLRFHFTMVAFTPPHVKLQR
jgi:hypothetical protein